MSHTPGTDDELRQIERRQYQRRSTNLIRDGALYILNDDKELVRFFPNAPQRRFLDLVDWLRDRGLPVRIAIHKARQWGGSSVVDALFYADMITGDNQFGMVLADVKDHSQSLFERVSLFQDHLEIDEDFGHLAPRKAPALGRAIKWANGSQIVVETAENRGSVGRSPTLSHLHCSEVAFWVDQSGTMLGALQAVPDRPGTVIIKESTANGIGDDWSSDILRLVVRGEEGHRGPHDNGNDGVWFLLFVPWFEIEKYTKPLPAGLSLEEAWDHLDEAELAPVRQRELWLREQGCTDEQLNWRRHRIFEKCRGQVILFNQEFPDAARAAFIGSGEVVFDAVKLEAMGARATKAVWERGRLDISFKGAKFVSDAFGPLEVLERPKPGHTYSIGGDFAEGILQDADSFTVIDRKTLKVVAVLSGQLGTDHAGPNLEALARWYNMAVVTPEANNHGVVAVKHLRENYELSRIYKREAREDTQKDRPNQATVMYGWKTSPSSKPVLIAALEVAIRNEDIDLLHPRVIHQLRVFERDPETGKMGAPPGQHDDDVISLALSVIGHQRMLMFEDTEEHLPPIQFDTWLGG